MKFGAVPIETAEGAIAAHGIAQPGLRIKKGTVLTAQHIRDLAAAGTVEVIVARLGAGDVHEDEAARRVAELVAGPGVRIDSAFTGRANLFSEKTGLLTVDAEGVAQINRIDPGLTFATLPQFKPVVDGRMVATVKIIPFALAGRVLEKAEAAVSRPLVSVAAYRAMRVGLVATTLPGLKPKVMDKTRHVLEARLERAGSSLIREIRVAHDPDAVAGAISALRKEGADLQVLFGASAITDIDDVLPEGIRRAGGVVRHFGMPVDPGNLLLLAAVDGAPVLGAPGCARSPVENGFDWVLGRLLAGFDVGPDAITGMGVGGLLMEIVSRPQPRQPVAVGGPVAAIVLAAGQSRRTGPRHKLLAKFDNEPLVRRTVSAVLDARVDPVVVVTGHRGDEIRRALRGLDVEFVDNPDYAEGLATSLRAGLAAVPAAAAGALVVLADMPNIASGDINRLLDAFDPAGGATIVLPTSAGKRGNPVLWGRVHFDALLQLSGDTGARHLLGELADQVVRVELGAAAALDLDTPEALARAGAALAD